MPVELLLKVCALAVVAPSAAVQNSAARALLPIVGNFIIRSPGLGLSTNTTHSGGGLLRTYPAHCEQAFDRAPTALLLLLKNGTAASMGVCIKVGISYCQINHINVVVLTICLWLR